MATAARPGLFARKPTDVLVREASGDSENGVRESARTNTFILQRGEGALEPAPDAGPA